MTRVKDSRLGLGFKGWVRARLKRLCLGLKG